MHSENKRVAMEGLRMDTLFVNRHTRNRALAKELYGYYYFRRPLSLVTWSVLLLCLAANVTFGVLGNKISGMVSVALAACLLLRFYSYYYMVNTMVKRDLELYEKEVEVETVVREDGTEVTTSFGETIALRYHTVKTVFQTKNYIFLRTKSNLIHIISRNGFTIGTSEDFLRFLKDKGLRVKVPKARDTK